MANEMILFVTKLLRAVIFAKIKHQQKQFTSFTGKKLHLQECLIYLFNLKKFAAEWHRLLLEAHGEATLSESSCRERFHKYNDGKYDVEDKVKMLGSRLKTTWKHFIGKSYPTRHFHQIVLLPLISCSNPWYMACLSNTLHHIKTKN